MQREDYRVREIKVDTKFDRYAVLTEIIVDDSGASVHGTCGDMWASLSFDNRGNIVAEEYFPMDGEWDLAVEKFKKEVKECVSRLLAHRSRKS